MQKIEVSTWKRKEHFEFFSSFEEPYFGVTVPVDVTAALSYCRKNEISFFLWYIHKTLLAVNSIENFGYRIDEDGNPYQHQAIGASATIMRADETFGFSDIAFSEGFPAFAKAAQKEIARVQNTRALFPPEKRMNIVHCSAIPWLHFSSITHSRIFKAKDSIPKFSYGKAIKTDGKLIMPVAVYVHHGLVDGLHVSRFFEKFQALLDSV